ncbi:hypothetical protein PTKIN_Ptkin19aG0132200 [Pterospermum kingtungense]
MSDADSTTHAANKRRRYGTSCGTSSSQYKGVMPQINGQWGAQLYANHTPTWPGTGAGAYINNGLSCELKFQKVLTPSDVGKQKRLVIPKISALKYFPRFYGSGKENALELVLYDKFLRRWNFRYCHWSSGQIYVITKGWNQFSKDNDLKPNDVVYFYRCESIKESEVFRFWMIDTNKIARGVDLQLRLGHGHGFDGEVQVKEEPQFMEEWPKQEQDLMAEHPKPTSFKLFGAPIVID